MTLLAADGVTRLDQATLPLTRDTVRWFIDGRQLLHHAKDLHQVRATLVCVACDSSGGNAHVHIRDRREDSVFVACPHRPSGGVVRVDRPLEVTPLLLALGWGLRCSQCGDDLQGNNDPATATSCHVTCACTSRDYAIEVG